ncbi:MAG TPA: hypothetical protein VLG12_06750, partial [Candidatus Saccharimonadales bacterium]|nr:hypothetical protein [Candidatus Saccharimonadales bacterium]
MNNRQSTNQSTNQNYFLYVSQDKENLPPILETHNNGVIVYPDPNDDHGSSSSGHRLYKACLMINGELRHEEVRIYIQDLPQDRFIENEDKNYAEIIDKVLTLFNIKVPASIRMQCTLLERARNHESKRKAEQERAANQAVTPHLTASEAESFDEEKNDPHSNNNVEYKQNSVMPKVESLDEEEENELKSSYSNNNDEYKQNSVMPAEKNPALSRAINYQICAVNKAISLANYNYEFLKDEAKDLLEIYIATIRVLLEQHADPNYIDENGNSLLHNTKLPQLITLLLEFGADPKILNSQGLTPIQTAIELNLYDCALTYGKARLK